MVDRLERPVGHRFRPGFNRLARCRVPEALVKPNRIDVGLLDRESRLSCACASDQVFRFSHQSRTKALVAKTAEHEQVGNRPTQPDQHMADGKPAAGKSDEQHPVLAFDRGPEDPLDLAAPCGKRPKVMQGRLPDFGVHDQAG